MADASASCDCLSTLLKGCLDTSGECLCCTGFLLVGKVAECMKSRAIPGGDQCGLPQSKARKIMTRLGGGPNITVAFPEKPMACTGGRTTGCATFTTKLMRDIISCHDGPDSPSWIAPERGGLPSPTIEGPNRAAAVTDGTGRLFPLRRARDRTHRRGGRCRTSVQIPYAWLPLVLRTPDS
jgi:hypothetical protein